MLFMRSFQKVRFNQGAVAAYGVLDVESQEEVMALCDKLDQGMKLDPWELEPIKNMTGLYAVRIRDKFKLIFHIEGENADHILVKDILNFYFFEQYYRREK